MQFMCGAQGNWSGGILAREFGAGEWDDSFALHRIFFRWSRPCSSREEIIWCGRWRFVTGWARITDLSPQAWPARRA